MKKLTKAQEKTLARIREDFNSGELEEEKVYWEKAIENCNDERSLEFYKEHVEMNKKGYILFHSNNSRTLEILAENNLIDYIKNDGRSLAPIDWVKLI